MQKLPCSGKTELFLSERAEDQAAAVELCHTCEFEMRCRRRSLQWTEKLLGLELGRQDIGVSGGLTQEERREACLTKV